MNYCFFCGKAIKDEEKQCADCRAVHEEDYETIHTDK
jgi:hypothetical protein